MHLRLGQATRHDAQDQTSRHRSRKLSIPKWVPESVAQFVREKYAADVRRVYAKAIRKAKPSYAKDDYLYEHLAEQAKVRAAYVDIVRDDLEGIAERYRSLVSGSRMRTVWHELSRQRKGGGFLYPALPQTAADARRQTAADASKRQAMAMVELFKLALECRHVVAPLTRAEAERQHRTFLAKADDLQADGETILRQRLSSD
jgi:hypothetical protein